MQSPFFSVVIPVFNKAPHIHRSLSSVFNQSCENFELIVIDDASTDGSLEEIKSFKDKRLHLYQRDEPGPGGYAARNLGVRKAKGEWICFLDADDSWENDYLLTYFNAIKKYKYVNIFSSSWVIKNNNYQKPNKTYHRFEENAINQLNYLDYLILVVNKCSPIWTSVGVVNRESFLHSNMFPAGKCTQGGDVDTWLRLMAQEKKMVHINKLMATYHRDSVQMVTKKYQDLSEGCIVPTCNRLIEQAKTKEEIVLLKKFSNMFLLSTIRRNILSDTEYSKLINKFHSKENPLIYLFVLISNLKPFNYVAKKYFERREVNF